MGSTEGGDRGEDGTSAAQGKRQRHRAKGSGTREHRVGARPGEEQRMRMIAGLVSVVLVGSYFERYCAVSSFAPPPPLPSRGIGAIVTFTSHD